MPPAKRSPSTASRSSSPRSTAKSTATTTRKAAGRTATQAKSGATRTRNTAQSGAAKTTRSARTTRAAATSTAKAAGSTAAGSAKSARTGAKGTATTAGARNAKASAKAATTRTRRTGGAEITSVAESLMRGITHPRDLVMLTRERIQETLDDAAARGRVTRKDANDLVAELVRRGRAERDDLRGELETLVKQGRGQLESASRRARSSESVDRVVRGADRARRTVGVGPSFPILGYDDLNARQVQSRITELSRPERRKVLTYERKHANRKSVVGALEKSLA